MTYEERVDQIIADRQKRFPDSTHYAQTNETASKRVLLVCWVGVGLVTLTFADEMANAVISYF